jgi:uncharacterized alpha-E superfamily protein
VLSRTADHVYWLARYNERAENLALELDVQYRLSLLPHAGTDPAIGWGHTLHALGMPDAYTQRFDEVEPHRVIDFLAFDRDNPHSIVSCLRAARENARAVRGSLTSEMWETCNATWLEARAQTPSRFSARNVAEFLEWVRHRANLARGVFLGSMLRDEAYHFLQLGSFLERADGVARMLGARLAQSSGAMDAREGEDFHPWSTLLRALSAFENYRRWSRDRVTPLRVCEFLIFREEVPRSLHRSMKQVYDNLRAVANSQSRETERRAGEVYSALRFGHLDGAAAGGFTPFLADLTARLADLSDRIGQDFLGHMPPV